MSTHPSETLAKENTFPENKILGSGGIATVRKITQEEANQLPENIGPCVFKSAKEEKLEPVINHEIAFLQSISNDEALDQLVKDLFPRIHVLEGKNGFFVERLDETTKWQTLKRKNETFENDMLIDELVKKIELLANNGIFNTDFKLDSFVYKEVRSEEGEVSYVFKFLDNNSFVRIDHEKGLLIKPPDFLALTTPNNLTRLAAKLIEDIKHLSTGESLSTDEIKTISRYYRAISQNVTGFVLYLFLTSHYIIPKIISSVQKKDTKPMIWGEDFDNNSVYWKLSHNDEIIIGIPPYLANNGVSHEEYIKILKYFCNAEFSVQNGLWVSNTITFIRTHNVKFSKYVTSKEEKTNLDTPQFTAVRGFEIVTNPHVNPPDTQAA